MKGIIIKDFYMVMKYARIQIVVTLVFILVSAFSGGMKEFVLFYSALMTAMIPTAILNYDDFYHWNDYCGGLPVRKHDIVCAKYIMGLIIFLIVMVIYFAAHVFGSTVRGEDALPDKTSFVLMAAYYFILSGFSLLPAFVFGNEKGRTLRIVVMVIVFAIFGVQTKMSSMSAINISSLQLSSILMGAFVIYFATWCLSIMFYKKGEKSA